MNFIYPNYGKIISQGVFLAAREIYKCDLDIPLDDVNEVDKESKKKQKQVKLLLKDKSMDKNKNHNKIYNVENIDLNNSNLEGMLKRKRIRIKTKNISSKISNPIQSMQNYIDKENKNLTKKINQKLKLIDKEDPKFIVANQFIQLEKDIRSQMEANDNNKLNKLKEVKKESEYDSDSDKSISSLHLDVEESNVRNFESIHPIKSNTEIQSIFQNDPSYKKCNTYNTNFFYERQYCSLFLSDLNKNWDNVEAIFGDSIIKMTKNINLDDIIDVIDHKFENFNLWYIFSLRNSSQKVACRSKTAYSNGIIDKIHDYLMFDYENKSDDITLATRIFECKYILYRHRLKIDRSVTKETFLNPRIRGKKKEGIVRNSLIKEIKMNQKYTKIIQTCDYQYGIEYKINKRKKFIALEDLKTIKFKSIYNSINKQIESKKEEIKKEKSNLDNKIISSQYQQYPKSRQKKMKMNSNFDKYYNQDNCFYHAIRSLSSKFWQNEFRNKFKSLLFPEQIKEANKVLMKYNQKFKLFFRGKEKLREYVLKTEGPSLLIFFKDKNLIHSEGVKDYKFIKDIQEHILNLLDEEIEIVEYRLIKIAQE